MEKTSSQIQILKATRKRVAKADSWCTESLAKNKYGDTVIFNNTEATKWCLVGALYMEGYLAKKSFRGAFRELSRSLKNIGETSLFVYNDDNTHKKVLNLIDKTIRRLTRKRLPKS